MLTPWADTLDRAQPLPEYPRPQMVRDSYLNLNGPWSYAITTSASKPAQADGTILVPFSPESELSGVGHVLQPEEYLWYIRTVTLPALRPAIGSAASVVFLFCATAFGVVLTLGGLKHSTVETEIYLLTTNFLDLPAAAALSVLQLLVVNPMQRMFFR